MDDTLDFFNSLMDTVPQQYKQIEKNEEQIKPGKKQKNSQKPALSMMELKEKAQSKIELIQGENRAKSMAKIKELTHQHQIDKKSKQGIAKIEGLGHGKGSDDDSDGEDEKPKYKNKNTVSEDKLANKRLQKQASKQKKLNQQKGIQQIDLDSKNKNASNK